MSACVRVSRPELDWLVGMSHRRFSGTNRCDQPQDILNERIGLKSILENLRATSGRSVQVFLPGISADRVDVLVTRSGLATPIENLY
jgi:hypothetical protein